MNGRAMDERSADFYKLEYTSSRAMIAQQYDKQYWWLVYVTSANGAIYLWLSEKSTSLASPMLAYASLIVSLVITIAGYLMFRINARTSQWAIDYCRMIERKFLGDEGWSDYFVQTARKTKWISTKWTISALFFVQLTLSALILVAFIIR
jgi:hypothetical protein